jgi:non-specific serine/threonine protein kinase
MFHPGDRIGPYALLRTLGRGAFGEVWLAERASTLLTTQVALKLPLDQGADLDAVREEAQAWLRASGHPNVVPVLDAEVYDGRPVIASEYIAGGSLADWLAQRDGQMPSTEEAVAIIRGILDGLQHLHEGGLIHRDLKPSNVLMQKGKPRLTDFGLARVLKPHAHTTNLTGTPAYMSPEAFKGDYSAASDVWATGVMLHELLVGSLPYPQTDLYGLLLAITNDEPVAISDHAPAALRSILERALAKPVGERFASATEMTAALALGWTAPGPARPQPRHNLPAQTTSFVGRETEIADVKGLLSLTRVLTLTGSGGSGKTRLSLQAAADLLEDYRDGVWLIELASLADPALVPQTAADALGIREEPGEPVTKTLFGALAENQTLLVLDNCEHLLDATAQLVNAISRGCPNVTILATSREPLRISGESTYRVPSLSLPDMRQIQTAESLAQYEAARLFVERATAVKTDFRLSNHVAPALAQLCHRLDGIPLAIELAAARVRSLAVEEVNSRLEDRFRLLTDGSRTALPRQRTLRALVDWSFDLLNPSEQAMLCRLAVFAGGWALDAGEAVCCGATGEEIESWEVLDLLTSLADKSLVVAETTGGATRYRLLETVRQYAIDRLRERGEAESCRCAHRDYFLALAEEARAKFTGPDHAQWLDRLETEHDNLRHAIAFCLSDAEDGPESSEAGLRLGFALSQFWWTRGQLTEGRDLLTALLARPGAQQHTRARAGALNGAGTLARMQSDLGSARALLGESLEIYRELDIKSGIAGCLLNLGNVAYLEGDFNTARSYYAESLEIKRGLGDKSAIANSLGSLANVAERQGDYESARALGQECLELFKCVGDRLGIANALGSLATVAAHQGDNAFARSLREEGLGIYRELGDAHGIALALDNLGVMASDDGDYATARALYDESLQMRRELGDRHGIAGTLNNLGNVALGQGDFPSVHALCGESLAMRRDLSDRRGIAESLESLAAVSVKERNVARAARLWAAADRLREEIGSPLPGHELDAHRQALASAETELGAAEFAEALQAGRAMTMERAIDFALEIHS